MNWRKKERRDIEVRVRKKLEREEREENKLGSMLAIIESEGRPEI